MSEPETRYSYVAMDGRGKRSRGTAVGRSEAVVFARLNADGLTPVSIRAVRRSKTETGSTSAGRLGGTEAAALVSDLAALLRAGSDIRTALAIIGGKADSPALRAAAKLISRDVGGGGSLDVALTAHLGERHAFIAALASAGEAAGDLASGLERAGEVLESRAGMRNQLVSALSYPLFVLATAVFGFLIILLMVVPSLAPLTEAPGARPGLALRLLLGASGFLRENLTAMAAAAGVLIVGGFAAGLAGLLSPLVDRLLLDGPTRRTTGQLVYGGFAVALGGILSAGAPMSDALRLSLRAVRSPLARRRLEPLAQAVRQGESLSTALGRVANLPTTIGRLAVIGEESGALGPMLARAGRLEEQAALRRVEAAGRVLGPVMIVVLGGLIGLMMAGLLSGVTDIGQSALD